MAKAQTEARDIAPFPEGVAIVCPGCGGFEMAATRSSLADRDWTWIGKMLLKGWEQKNASPETIREMPFGCQCKPKRVVVCFPA